MPLLPPTLITGLTTALVSSNIKGTSRNQVADRITKAYDIYAKAGQSCALLPVAKVNTPSLKSKLRKSMSGNAPNVAIAAKDWSR